MLKIPPDQTFLIQIAVFVVFWLLVRRLWFEPALRIIRERTVRSEGAIREARAIEAEAERLRAEHAAALDQTKSEAQRELQEIVRSAEAEQKRLVAEASAEAQRTLAEVQARVAEEVARTRRALQDEAAALARMVTEKVLGRPA